MPATTPASRAPMAIQRQLNQFTTNRHHLSILSGRHHCVHSRSIVDNSTLPSASFMVIDLSAWLIMITLTTTVMAVATTVTRRCRSNFCSSRATRWPNTCRLEPSVTVQVLKKREGKRLSAIDRENSSRSNDNREMYRPKRRPVATRAPVRRRNRVNPALPMTLLLLLRQPLL